MAQGKLYIAFRPSPSAYSAIVEPLDYAQSGLDKTEALAKAQNVHVQTKLVDLIEEPLLIEKYDGLS
ncbi:hypothetical protein ACOMCU_27040 [Lysinibacillus sp. UGB7]|uniref:hypothetical protein n=1 Tax=Lysinibacillus sp. UGB7 TaxID=3411039 RepID=UPI003B79342D